MQQARSQPIEHFNSKAVADSGAESHVGSISLRYWEYGTAIRASCMLFGGIFLSRMEWHESTVERMKDGTWTMSWAFPGS